VATRHNTKTNKNMIKKVAGRHQLGGTSEDTSTCWFFYFLALQTHFSTAIVTNEGEVEKKIF